MKIEFQLVNHLLQSSDYSGFWAISIHNMAQDLTDGLVCMYIMCSR